MPHRRHRIVRKNPYHGAAVANRREHRFLSHIRIRPMPQVEYDAVKEALAALALQPIVHYAVGDRTVHRINIPLGVPPSLRDTPAVDWNIRPSRFTLKALEKENGAET